VLTILQQQSKTLAFVSLLVLNNKFSSQDETTSGLYILYPFSKYQAFLAALQVTEMQQADKNRRATTTTTREHKTTAQRQQQGNTTPVVVRTRCAVPTVLHLTYRAPVHYRIRSKCRTVQYVRDELVDRPGIDQQVVPRPLKSLSLHPGALDCF
jgi:hypothetical protein